MNARTDVIVLGAGPAGAAAAVWGASLGLEVTLVERSAFPRFRPGETLHPGVQAILRQLGVANEVESACRIRPEGQVVSWGAASRYQPYGRDKGGAWRAFQIERATLDAILLARARCLGVRLIQPARAYPVVRNGRIDRVRTDVGELAAAFVIDATGASGTLRRALGLGQIRRSPPLTAFYGYARGSEDDVPRLEGNADGWTWTAQIDASVTHWCRLNFRGGRSRLTAPLSLLGRPPIGGVRAADVTWRRTVPAGGSGYFLVGDAAFVLDPAAAHGVLRALMSGMKAVQTVFDVLAECVDDVAAAARYEEWISTWFECEAARLADLYGELDPGWPTPVGRGRHSSTTEQPVAEFSREEKGGCNVQDADRGHSGQRVS